MMKLWSVRVCFICVMLSCVYSLFFLITRKQSAVVFSLENNYFMIMKSSLTARRVAHSIIIFRGLQPSMQTRVLSYRCILHISKQLWQQSDLG